jgi:hypothetical protein
MDPSTVTEYAPPLPSVQVLSESTRAHAVVNIAAGDVSTLPTIYTTPDDPSEYTISSVDIGPQAALIAGKYHYCHLLSLPQPLVASRRIPSP